MKKFIYIAVLSLVSFTSTAQVGYQFTQHYMEPFMLNAAFAGTKPCYSIAAVHHNQWQTFEIPNYTTSISIHKGTNNKGLKSYKSGWHGFGAQILDDQLGNFHTFNFSLTYAYHIKVKEHAALSLGSFLSLKRINFNEQRLKLKDSNDPSFSSKDAVLFFPIISPGVAYYTKTFSAGISVHNFFKKQAKSFGNQYGTPSDMNTMIYASAAKKFIYYDFYQLIPSIQIRYDGYEIPSVDAQLTWSYDDMFSATLGYRIEDAAIAGFQVRILERWRFGYAYEYTLSKMSNTGQHSHELCITFISCFKNGGMDPRFYCPAYANAQSTNP